MVRGERGHYAHSTPRSRSSLGWGFVIPAVVVESVVMLSAWMVVSAVEAADTIGDAVGDVVSAAIPTATLSEPILILSRCIPTTGATGCSQTYDRNDIA